MRSCRRSALKLDALLHLVHFHYQFQGHFQGLFRGDFHAGVLDPILASLFVVKGVDRDVKRSCMRRSRCATLSSAAWAPSGSSMTSTEPVHSSSLTATQFREKELHSRQFREKELSVASPLAHVCIVHHRVCVCG